MSDAQSTGSAISTLILKLIRDPITSYANVSGGLDGSLLQFNQLEREAIPRLACNPICYVALVDGSGTHGRPAKKLALPKRGVRLRSFASTYWK